MVRAFDVRRQEFAHGLQHLLHVLKFLDLDTEQRVNYRQVVGGVGKTHLGVGVKGLQSLLYSPSTWENDVVRTLNRSNATS